MGTKANLKSISTQILSAPKCYSCKNCVALLRDSVTVILTAPSLQMYVMSGAVTEEIVTRSRRLVEFSVSKWQKLTQFHLFTPLFD